MVQKFVNFMSNVSLVLLVNVSSFMFNSSKIDLFIHPHLWLFRITAIIEHLKLTLKTEVLAYMTYVVNEQNSFLVHQFYC